MDKPAEVVKLVDTQRSGRCALKGVGVRVPPSALLVFRRPPLCHWNHKIAATATLCLQFYPALLCFQKLTVKNHLKVRYSGAPILPVFRATQQVPLDL